MPDDAAVLLLGARHKTRCIHEREQRDMKGIAKADKARTFIRGVNIQHASQHFRLVGDHSHGFAAQAGKTYHQVGGITALHLEELTAVH